MPSKNKEVIRRYQAKYYQKNIEYYKLKAKEQKKKTSDLFVRLKSTLGCHLCNECDPCALDFHHYDPSEKGRGIRGKIGEMARSGWGWESIIAEIEKCICLCSNCHRKVHTYPEKYSSLSREDCVKIPGDFLSLVLTPL